MSNFSAPPTLLVNWWAIIGFDIKKRRIWIRYMSFFSSNFSAPSHTSCQLVRHNRSPPTATCHVSTFPTLKIRPTHTFLGVFCACIWCLHFLSQILSTFSADKIQPRYNNTESFLIFVTSSITAGCVKNLAKLNVSNWNAKKMLFAVYKVLHTVLLQDNFCRKFTHFQGVKFLDLKSRLCKKWQISGMHRITSHSGTFYVLLFLSSNIWNPKQSSTKPF